MSRRAIRSALGLTLLIFAAAACATDPGFRETTPPASRARQPAGPPAAGPAAAKGDAFASDFVDAHNRQRRAVGATPALPSVSWSPALARQAQTWARRCEFEHSGSDQGENLSARTDVAPPAVIVQDWASEGGDFDYRKNRCAPGRVCGHYTQLVWRDSVQIGCAMANCSTGSPFGGGEWVSWVCNYSPAGNWSGERPY